MLSFCFLPLTVLLFAYYCLLWFGFDCYGCVQSTQSRSGLWGFWDRQAIAQVIARAVEFASYWARVHFFCARVALLASHAPPPFLLRALPSRRRSLAPPLGRARALAASLLPALCASPACGLAIGCCMRCAWRISACRWSVLLLQKSSCSCTAMPSLHALGPSRVCQCARAVSQVRAVCVCARAIAGAVECVAHLSARSMGKCVTG